MKKQTSKKKLVEQTVARLKEAQVATQEKVDAIFSGIDPYKPTDHRAVTGYLYHAERNALDLEKEILPTVADIKAHPLPALQDLTADPFSHRTIKDTTSEITCHLERIANTRKSYALEDFYSWYQNFLDAVQRLYEKKIAVCDTLGKTDVKRKLIEAFTILPKSSAPEEFKISFRRALMLDAEATEEINNTTATVAPTVAKKSKREEIVSLVYEIYTSKEWQHQKLIGDKTPKRMSYLRAICIMIDEPIPKDNPFYERTKEAREIIKRMAKGGDDTKIRNSLRTQVINYAKSIKPTTHKTLTIGQAVSRLSPTDKQTVRDALDLYGEDYSYHDRYMGTYPTIGDSSAHR